MSLLHPRYKKKTVTRQDVVDVVYTALRNKGTPLTYAVVNDIITTFCADIGDAMLNGSIVEIRGFGVFYPFNLRTWYRPELESHLPASKGRMIPPRVVISRVFRPSKLLIAKVNGETNELFTQYLDGSDTP